MKSAVLRAEPALGPGSMLEGSLFRTRSLSAWIAEPLTPEDQTVQASEDASPTKWHLAHTSWFFETFVLSQCLPDYRVFDDSFAFCFNSYYETQGPRHPRPERGLLSRPSASQILDYRAHVDEGLRRLFASGEAAQSAVAEILEIGVNHEQQHQELMLTDALALFARNPLRPAYRMNLGARVSPAPEGSATWVAFAGGVLPVGCAGPEFHWDNEEPRHQALLRPFKLSNRLVTNSEWIAFMNAGGYEEPMLWLSDGWATVRREGWRAPLYFEERDGDWLQMGLGGLQPLDPLAPVRHVSFYEAEAFARWAGKRLPTEFEWEIASEEASPHANDLSSGLLTPTAAPSGDALQQMFGDVWEWTQSAYLPYPGYRPPAGAIGEYNGKFMSGQMVLRGGSCVTPHGHTRASYRNFFYPGQRWQFAGLRLAEDAE